MNKLNKLSNDKWRWLFQLRVYSDQRTEYAAILFCLIYFPSHDRNERGWLRLQTRRIVGGSARSLKTRRCQKPERKTYRLAEVCALNSLLLISKCMAYLLYPPCSRPILPSLFCASAGRMDECAVYSIVKCVICQYPSWLKGDLRRKHFQRPSLDGSKAFKYALLLSRTGNWRLKSYRMLTSCRLVNS